jgi:hypothetical protein
LKVFFGVFLLISKKYDSSEPEELKVSPQDDIELVWVKIKTLGSNSRITKTDVRVHGITKYGERVRRFIDGTVKYAWRYVRKAALTAVPTDIW